MLAKLGSDRAKVPPGIFVEELIAPSIKQLGNTEKEKETTDPMEIDQAEEPDQSRQIMVIQSDWRQTYIDFIKEKKLPEDKAEATRVVRRSKNYVLVGDKLYKRAASLGVLLKCVPTDKEKEILDKIHSGCYGNHAASRTLVCKAFRTGFYWPTALKDAEELIRTCKNCQMFARQSHVPAHNLICIPPAWPFSCWGLDQVGPLKKAKGGFEYIFVAIDKFTKWIEYKPLVKYSAEKAVEFIQDIMHRFGMPNRIITDLGSPFTAREFQYWARDCGIEIDFASVAHPQANGQVERANGLILQGLKPRLYEDLKDYGGKWIDELPKVVWGLRTQISRATGYSPFFLVYGSEAVLPADLIWLSPRIEQYEEGEAEETRRLEIDSIEEIRDSAIIQNARYQQGLRRHYDKSTQPRSLKPGDSVLRLIQKKDGRHKLLSPWEGPFIVKTTIVPGTYELMTPDEIPVKNTWHISQLKRFYN